MLQGYINVNIEQPGEILLLLVERLYLYLYVIARDSISSWHSSKSSWLHLSFRYYTPFLHLFEQSTMINRVVRYFQVDEKNIFFLFRSLRTEGHKPLPESYNIDIKTWAFHTSWLRLIYLYFHECFYKSQIGSVFILSIIFMNKLIIDFGLMISYFLLKSGHLLRHNSLVHKNFSIIASP